MQKNKKEKKSEKILLLNKNILNLNSCYKTLIEMDKRLSFQINTTQVEETIFDINEFTEEEYNNFEKK